MSEAEPATGPAVGDVIGQRFEIKERLDDTGQAEVYRAQHILIHREVALKVARASGDPGDKLVARFQRVARTALQLEHPNCVRIADFGVDEHGYAYLAMELAQGRDLRSLLAQDGPLQVADVIAMGRQALSGLEEAHARGILHTELATHYVMVDLEEPDAPRVKLLGFGLGQLMKGIEEGKQSRGRIDGAAADYAAPELLQPVAQVDHRADLFALAAVLFEALTGELPWEVERGGPQARLSQSPRRASRVRPDAQIGLALDSLLSRALDPDPSRRFGDAREMARSLEQAITQEDSGEVEVASLYQVFGRYRLLRTIARGGMGELHLASSETLPGLTKVCALKRLRPDLAAEKSYVDRFLAEARLAVRLAHANITTVYDVGKADDCFYMAMEYVVGKDCRRIIDRAREDRLAIPVDVAIFIARELSDALGYAHRVKLPDGDVGLIHRDVSPTNVMVSYEGQVKLIDFGLAKHASAAGMTASGIVIGKIAYMAPEQCLGETLDHRADIFSVGAVLFELLTGRRLREESDLEQLAHLVRQPPEQLPGALRPDVPPALDRIIAKAVAPNLEDRYQTAEGLRDDLEQVLRELQPRMSHDGVAAFLGQLFPAEVQSETELAQGLLTARAPQEPDSALADDGAFRSDTQSGKTVAVSVISEDAFPPARPRDTERQPQASSAHQVAARTDPTLTTKDMAPGPADPDATMPDVRPRAGAAPLPQSTPAAAEPAGRSGPGWLVAVILLVLGLGGGFAARHLLPANSSKNKTSKQGQPPPAGGQMRAAVTPRPRIPGLRRRPVRPRPGMVAAVAPTPTVDATPPVRRAAPPTRPTALLVDAAAALQKVALEPRDLVAFPTVQKAFEVLKQAVTEGKTEAAKVALGHFGKALKKSAGDCERRAKRLVKWCRAKLRALRKLAPERRKDRKAYLERLDYYEHLRRVGKIKKRLKKGSGKCRRHAATLLKIVGALTASETKPGGGAPAAAMAPAMAPAPAPADDDTD